MQRDERTASKGVEQVSAVFNKLSGSGTKH